MLHTKFRGNRSAGSGEDFLMVFTIYGHDGHLSHVTSILLIYFHFHVPKYSHTVINSISCLHLPTFRSQASIVSEKSTVFTFSYRKA